MEPDPARVDDERPFTRRVRDAVARDIPFLGIVAAYFVVALVSNRLTGLPRNVDLRASWAIPAGYLMVYALVATVVVTAHAVLRSRRSLFKISTWRRISRTVWDPARLARFALVFLALPVLMHVFINFKEAIPSIQPFVWDERFMKWDRALHFGVHPYQWLQPVLGRPLITLAVDFVYFLWIPVMWFTTLWQAWHGRNEHVRSQFLLAFALCWIVLGTAMAIGFSSAGPVYYEAVVGPPDPFAPLLGYLTEVGADYELRALMFHDLLWDGYMNPDVGGLGISAMPSMHVAIAVLMALLGFATNRALGWVYTAFAVAIMLGSVHLAWHYAIDGYVGGLAAAGIWWACGSLSGRPSKAIDMPTQLISDPSP